MPEPLTLRRLMTRASPRLILVASIASIAVGLFQVLMVGVVNAELRRRGTGLTFATYLAVCALVFALEMLARFALIRVGLRAVLEIRADLFRRILGSPLRQVEVVGSARVFAAISENVEQIEVSILQTPPFIAHFVMVVGCLGYCVVLWPLGGLALIVALAGAVAAAQVLHRRGVHRLIAGDETVNEIFQQIRAGMDGAKELKLHAGRRAAFRRRFDENAEAVRALQTKAMTLMQLSFGWGNIYIFVLLGALLFALPRLGGAEPGRQTGFVLALVFLAPALDFVIIMYNILARANVGLSRMASLGLTDSESEELAPGRPVAWQRLQLAGITHRYRREDDDAPFVLGPIDLELEPGETVFLIGGNGSGKSTLAKVLTGLYPPDAGEIRLDGEPVTAENRGRYRGLFSAVFADFFLFDRMVGLDVPDLDERARHYLAKLKLENKVRVKDGVLSTVELSQGQRKRLALLTAYLEDRSFYVFDEWAADQDPEFREVFYRQLLPELKQRGKTVLAITHDDRYFDIADRVVKLEMGRIAPSRA